MKKLKENWIITQAYLHLYIGTVKAGTTHHAK